MPRIQVITSLHNQQDHRRIAAAITGVFAAEGMSPEHVSTEFHPIQHTLVYAGRESLDEVLGKRDFALLRVYISTRRGQEFRDALVATVVRAFDGLGVDPSQVAIDFVPREAVDAYIGTVLMGAAYPPSTGAGTQRPDHCRRVGRTGGGPERRHGRRLGPRAPESVLGWTRSHRSPRQHAARAGSQPGCMELAGKGRNRNQSGVLVGPALQHLGCRNRAGQADVR